MWFKCMLEFWLLDGEQEDFCLYFCSSPSCSPSLCSNGASILQFPGLQFTLGLMVLLMFTSSSGTQDTASSSQGSAWPCHLTFIIYFPKLLISHVPEGSENNDVWGHYKAGNPIPAPDLQTPLPLKNQTLKFLFYFWFLKIAILTFDPRYVTLASGFYSIFIIAMWLG